MLSVKILIAVYFSHLLVFSHKTLGLCRESLILLEYHKKKKNFLSEGYKVVIDFLVQNGSVGPTPDVTLIPLGTYIIYDELECQRLPLTAYHHNFVRPSILGEFGHYWPMAHGPLIKVLALMNKILSA
jgi:hypothetical protein